LKKAIGDYLRPKNLPALSFCLSFVAMQVSILALCSWGATKEWFMYHDANPSLLAYGYAHHLHATRCDILVTGDSTARAAFVPSVIAAGTGLTTCNISEVRPIGDLVGTEEPLDAYLANNPPPRLVIVGLTPTNFYLQHPRGMDAVPYAIEYALQFDRGPWLWEEMLRHPSATAEWATWAEQAILKDLLDRVRGKKTAKWRTDPGALRAAQGGVWAMSLPAQRACEFPRGSLPTSTYEQNAWGASEFRKKYQSTQMSVLIYATPVAACDPNLARGQKLIRGLSDNRLEIRPVTDFNDQNVHLTPEAAKQFSAEVAGQIVDWMSHIQTASR
jgi:hypothetical protein